MGKPHGSRRGGFTLVEVLLSSGMLVIGLVAVAAAVTSLALLRRTYTETQLATAAARTKLEQLRGEDFDTLLVNYGNGVAFTVDLNGDGYPDLAPTVGQNVPGSIRVEDVVDVPPAALGKLRRAIATVQWRGVTGDRQVRLVTLLSNRS